MSSSSIYEPLQTGVYNINCIPTYKFYVGSTAVGYKERWYEHRRLLNKGEHHCDHLQNAWNKHGEEAFEFFPVEDVSIEDLLPVWSEKHQAKVVIPEQKWIHHHWDADRLFNSARLAGSQLGFRHSDESKRQISQLKIDWFNTEQGKLQSQKHSQFMHEWAKTEAAQESSRRGIAATHTPEALERMSQTKKDWFKTEEGQAFRVEMSEAKLAWLNTEAGQEWIRKNAESRKDWANTEEGRAMYQNHSRFMQERANTPEGQVDIRKAVAASKTPEAIEKQSQSLKDWCKSEVGQAHIQKRAAARRSITPEQVEEIRQRAANGEKRSVLEKEYGVSSRTIRRVINRQRGY